MFHMRRDEAKSSFHFILVIFSQIGKTEGLIFLKLHLPLSSLVKENGKLKKCFSFKVFGKLWKVQDLKYP